MDCWYAYIVVCSDNSLYAGIANDLEKRLYEHNNSKNGAKYTRARRPVRLVYKETFQTRSEAAKREYQLKKMDRKAKLKLVEDEGRG